MMELCNRAGGAAVARCSQLLETVKSDPLGPPVGDLFAQWVAAQTQETDVAVVGAGMAGTAAAYWLAREAPHMKGLVLEQATVAHAGGSSYGKSRMYREMYSDPYFSKMQVRHQEQVEINLSA